MPEKKHVAMSSKNLRKCWEWAEKNNSQLALWYVEACCVLSIDPEEVLGDGEVGLGAVPKPEGWRLYWEAMDYAFRARDTIGRLVLRHIKHDGVMEARFAALLEPRHTDHPPGHWIRSCPACLKKANLPYESQMPVTASAESVPVPPQALTPRQ